MAIIAATESTERSLEVHWSDGVVTRYPWLWLRDHSHDPATSNPITSQREVFTADLAPQLKGLDVEVGTVAVTITWDLLEPVSVVPIEFLVAHRHARTARPGVDVPATLWNAGSVRTPTVQYADVMASDAGVAQWLGRTMQYGFCIVEGTPPDATLTEALLRRVAYVRQTIFGDFWEFEADLARADSAYTNQELRGHTDGTYSHDAPGCQLLHCLEFDGAGGESTLVDGFAIARRIEAEEPELFEVLSTVAVPGRYIGEGAHLVSARPVFRHDHTGRLVQVSFNNYDRAPFLLDEHDHIEFYNALRLFDHIANEPAMQWRHVLQPGEAMLFDNWRVLHGRTAFTGHRRMCGGYVNREDVESRLRQLL
ncbi:MAG: trimethyllysine dioxygenase [Actinomycetota bacterium]